MPLSPYTANLKKCAACFLDTNV